MQWIIKYKNEKRKIVKQIKYKYDTLGIKYKHDILGIKYDILGIKYNDIFDDIQIFLCDYFW